MANPFASIGMSDADLAKARETAAIRLSMLGVKYEKYIGLAADRLLEIHPAAGSVPQAELIDLIRIADVVAIDSRAMMKRMKSACSGCGWCCSQTRRIVIDEEDANRISRVLKRKRDDIFTFDGKEWLIKQAHPCGWWNPKNGRCLIYNDRPRAHAAPGRWAPTRKAARPFTPSGSVTTP
jgi:hypothetical protein